MAMTAMLFVPVAMRYRGRHNLQLEREGPSAEPLGDSPESDR